MKANELGKRLFVLAEVCGAKLNEYQLAMYDAELSKLGYDVACAAVDKIFVTRKGTDKFPSIADIKAVAQPKLDPKHEANEAAARIVQAVSKFGYTSGTDAKEFIGELGWIVVQRHGGWASVCLMLNHENTSLYKAQFRDLALSLSARAEAGIETPPALPVSEKTKSVVKLMEPKTNSDDTKESS